MTDLHSPRDILSKLVSFDTTSRNSNLPLIEWIEGFLDDRGIASVRVSDGDKASLYAIVGPTTEGGVVLSGHTDVVPVDDQPWTSDPWVLTSREGKLFGRGVADMKSFIALCLGSVDLALKARIRRPMILAFSHDEEIGCLGAPLLIEQLIKNVPSPSAVIVGEPTSMRVVSGHKSVSVLHVTVEGSEAHSSLPEQGVSAIMEAVPLMHLVRELGERARLRANPTSLFDPPAATMTIGQAQGGTAVNILARKFEFTWDLRCPPDDDPRYYVSQFTELAKKIDAEIRERVNAGGVTVVEKAYAPALAPNADSAAERLARRLTGDNETRHVSYAAEGGQFQQAGLPVVLCGPGSIEQAHQPDEWIDQHQLDEGGRFMSRLIDELAN